MTSAEFSDQRAVVLLKQELMAAVERAYALAWAIARLEGRAAAPPASGQVRDTILTTLDQIDVGSRPAPIEPPERGARSPAPGNGAARAPTPQELILETLGAGEVSVRDLQIVLEDHGLEVSPGNLSVILSRMFQARMIDRTGRGLYTVAKGG